MWSKQFLRATIEEKSNHVVLTITYGYYFIMEYREVFVCDTVEQAKTRLLIERSRDHLVVIGKDGKERNQSLL
jgi:hypothetical protein